MKKLILLLGFIICLAAAQVVFGQEEGSIIYKIKVNMHRNIPAEKAEMKEVVPEFNEYNGRLVFKGEESYFSPVEDEQEDEFNGDDGQMHVRIRRPQADYYYNRSTGKSIIVREFFGKHFLIEDSIRLRPWKLSEDVKTVQGHRCKKASYRDQERDHEVVAWYAEKLHPFRGPEEFNGLPGTVLEVDINKGERLIFAEVINEKKLSKGELVIPHKGQRITEEEFRKMMEEHRKRMGGNVMIRN